MRSLAALAILTSLALVRSASAQRPPSTALCATADGPSIQHLQALAREYHPEALTPVQSGAYLLIGLVLDSQCRVLHHTTGQRPGERIDLEATLASLFPDVRTKPFVTAGIADATADRALGSPWIIWTVVKS